MNLGSTRMAALVTLALITGCGSPAPRTSSPCASDEECPTGGRCLDGTCSSVDPMTLPDGGELEAAVAIRPEGIVLSSIDGTPASQRFEVVAIDPRDGSERPVPGALWSLGHLRVGDIDGDGVFTAHGRAGGEVSLRAQVAVDGALRVATGMVTVRVERTLLADGVPGDMAATFPTPASGEPGTQPDLLYPLDGAVMPANVFPPTVQWAPLGAEGDVFRVELAKPHASIRAFLRSAPGFPHAWPIPADLWQAIADSDPDDDVTVTVDRLDAATGAALAGIAPRRFRLARGSVYGAVYYEHRTPGVPPRLYRIDPETGARDTVVANPPPDSGGNRCIGCHALSHDGRYLWADNHEGATTYDLTTDLSGDPAPTRYPARGGASVASFDPSGRWFVGGNHVRGPLGIFDAATGAPIPTEGLPADGAAYPSWSPDGTAIAFAFNIALGPDGDPQAGNPIAGDLYLANVTGDAPSFAAPTPLHLGATLADRAEGGASDTHPTWSPDSRFVAFQHGVGVWTHVVRNPGALYLVSRDGAHVHRLDHATGGADATDAYWPTFSPYTTDEPEGRRFFWLAFYSRRPYGNALAGTAGTDHRQLWVAAIDADPTDGVDASSVPYWLPGQDIRTSNFSAFWAPEPCRPTGSGCSASAECCSERCEEDPEGALICGSPPPSECRRAGMTCGSAEDCCDGMACIGNVCAAAPI